jgi:hypothetical protein
LGWKAAQCSPRCLPTSARSGGGGCADGSWWGRVRLLPRTSRAPATTIGSPAPTRFSPCFGGRLRLAHVTPIPDCRERGGRGRLPPHETRGHTLLSRSDRPEPWASGAAATASAEILYSIAEEAFAA